MGAEILDMDRFGIVNGHRLNASEYNILGWIDSQYPSNTDRYGRVPISTPKPSIPTISTLDAAMRFMAIDDC